MPKWEIVGQFTVEADTSDAAIAWLKAELAAKLQPGYVLGSVRELRGDPGVPPRWRE